MVDASLRMSIVNLFRALRDELEVSIIYITHDLATAYTISDRMIIMQQRQRGGGRRRRGSARCAAASLFHPAEGVGSSPDDVGKGRLTAERGEAAAPERAQTGK